MSDALKDVFERFVTVSKSADAEWKKIWTAVPREEVNAYLSAREKGLPLILNKKLNDFHALWEEKEGHSRILRDRTGLSPVAKGSSGEYALSGFVDGKNIEFDAGNIHNAPDRLNPKPPVPVEPPAASNRTWGQYFSDQKNGVKQWSQNNRAFGAVTGVAGVAAGGFMSYDGFKRVRRGLGFDTDKDGKALQGSVLGTVAGGVEMLAGAGLVVTGGYTAIHAAKGKAGPSTPAP